MANATKLIKKPHVPRYALSKKARNQYKKLSESGKLDVLVASVFLYNRKPEKVEKYIDTTAWVEDRNRKIKSKRKMI